MVWHLATIPHNFLQGRLFSHGAAPFFWFKFIPIVANNINVDHLYILDTGGSFFKEGAALSIVDTQIHFNCGHVECEGGVSNLVRGW